jgi:hypothetical protein
MNEAEKFYCRMLMSAPDRTADEVECAMQREMGPLKAALQTALNLLDARIASRSSPPRQPRLH